MNLATARVPWLVLGIVAVVLGVAIAWVDTRPGWDDAGITAFALAGAAGLVAMLGLRFWFAAILVAVPIAAAYLPHLGMVHLLAPLFALAGAAAGAIMRRAFGTTAA